ncbi:TPA: hypothetical protein HA246_02900 [Candidatus Woesearchaeota archaeon]|nr:hypothetical protein [Candidatus Woesearchaeota archaeon]
MFSLLSRVLGLSRTERDDAIILKKEAVDSFRLHFKIKTLVEEIVTIEEELEQDRLEFERRSGKSLRNTQAEGMLRHQEEELVKKLNELKVLLRKSEIEEHHMESCINEIKKFVTQNKVKEKIGNNLDLAA